MSRRALFRVGILVQLLALVALVALGVWWFSVTRGPTAAPAESGDPTVTAFVTSVKNSLATETALGTPQPK